LAYPTITATTPTYSTGNTNTPPLQTHAANDILVVAALQGVANPTLTCGTSGWAAITTAPTTNGFVGTHFFWKRATSAAETNPTVSSDQTTNFYATTYVVSGCIATGTPFEDATIAGSPTFNTTPASAAIDTTGTERLALCIALIEDNNVRTDYPPATWDGVQDYGTDSGTDFSVVAISKQVATASTVTAVNACTQDASDYWQSLTLAFIPASSGTVYEKTGSATSAATSAAPDQYTATEAGTAVSAAVASGSDQATFSDAGLAASAASASGSDQATFSETGAAVSAAVASGSRIRDLSRSGQAASGPSSSGADQATFSDTGTATSAASASGSDQVTFARAGLAVSAFTASGLATAGSIFEKSGAAVSTLVASAARSLTLARAGIAQSAATLLGARSVTYARSGAASAALAALGSALLNPDLIGRNRAAASAGAGGIRSDLATANPVP